MSVKAYDDAIINKFRSIFNDNTIYILPVENAIRFSAQLNKDNVKFPMISTTRLGYSIRKSDINFSAKMYGSFVTRDGENNNVFAQTIPIRIEYQLDVFTVDHESCDEIVRELIFFFEQHPTLEAHFDYGLNIDHNFNIYLNEEIVDNSDTVEHVNNGVMFRNTLTFYTDDAILFRSKKQKQGEVIAKVEPLSKPPIREV
jgi:hypothetical protein